MKKILAAFIILVGLTSYCAAEQPVSEEDTVKAEFEKAFPRMSVDSVSKTPVNGIYEMISG